MSNRRTLARVPSHVSKPSRALPYAVWPRRRLQRALQRGAKLALSLAMISCGESRGPAAPDGDAAGVSTSALLVDQPQRTSLAVAPPSGPTAGALPPTEPPCPVTVPSAPQCTGESAIAASDLTPGRPVDSLAIRLGSTVRSSVGVVCSTAKNRLECEAAARVPYDVEHLITTEGDEVRIWSLQSAQVLLTPVDTVGEARWLVAARGYSVPCGTPVIETEAGFQIDNATRSGGCGGIVTAHVVVDAAGNVVESQVSPQGG